MSARELLIGNIVGFRHNLLTAFFAIIFTIAFIPLFTYIHFASDLAAKESIVSHNDTGIILLDRKNRPFFTFYSAKLKKEIPLSEIPTHTQQAAISVEDRDFYKHPGFSAKSMVRAFVDNLQNKELSYGASTITQQLVKNSLLTPKKSFLRKYQEVVLAQEIERRYTKAEILEMYLNSVYFGEGAFGVEEAALTYFNKHAKDLDLAESSLLAGLLPAPGKLSPLSDNADEAKVHQLLVLEKMVEQKYISPEQKKAAEEKDLKFNLNKDDVNFLAPHFALMVRSELLEQYGEERVVRSGFKVRTSLDLDWQKYAESVVAEQVKKLTQNRASNGAAVVMDPKTGEIRALVGSKDWYDDRFGKVNIALAERPPGSAFKPIVYLRGFEERVITPATILNDRPTTFANFDEKTFFASFPSRAAAETHLRNDPNAYYRPQNFDKKFRGPVTVRNALANSLNVPSVELLSKVGVDDAIKESKIVGLTTLRSRPNYGLSLVLGTAEVKLLELTNFYATLANKGFKNDPATILEIEDKKDQIIYQYEPKQERVADEKNVFLISSILSDSRSRAEVFGNALNISRPAAVKTGTTEDFKDAWTLGYTPSLAVGVWVGNNFGEPMDGVAGSLGAAPIWRGLMEKFLAGTKVETFEPPAGIVRVAACLNPTSTVATSSATVEYFVQGTEPKTRCLFVPSGTSSATPRATPAPILIIDRRDNNEREEQDNNREGRGRDNDRGRRGRGGGD